MASLEGVDFADLADEHGQPTSLARRLMAEGGSGVDVELDPAISPRGLDWLKRDPVKLQLNIDKAAKAVLYETCNQLLISPSDLIQTLIAWMSGRFVAEGEDAVCAHIDEPYIQWLVDSAVRGSADWDEAEESEIETPRGHVADWLQFWRLVWSREFVAKHASFKIALQPKHNQLLRRLAYQRGISKAALVGEIIEALAKRDLPSVTPTKASDGSEAE